MFAVATRLADRNVWFYRRSAARPAGKCLRVQTTAGCDNVACVGPSMHITRRQWMALAAAANSVTLSATILRRLLSLAFKGLPPLPRRLTPAIA